MKSVLFRAFLMILVVLPLGTFRTLHALLRSARPAVSHVASAQTLRTNVRGTSRGNLFLCDRSSNAPVGKLRFRNWADVTFLASESPQVCDAWIDVAPLTTVEASQRHASCPCEFRSPLVVHRTPREAIIAARTLLI